jgi:hypothetical protein
MRKAALEIGGLLLIAAAVIFFYLSVDLLSTGDHFAGLLEIFVGFSLIRAGLELTKLSILEQREND